MAVERGLYKPSVDPYQKTLVEVRKGFEPARFKKQAGAYDRKKEARFEKGYKAVEEAEQEEVKGPALEELPKVDKFKIEEEPDEASEIPEEFRQFFEDYEDIMKELREQIRDGTESIAEID
jgi:hypothetical protein